MATRFCTQCGQPIEGDTKFCTNCGASIPAESYTPQPEPQPQPQPQQQPVNQMTPRPKSYLALAILTTIFCCLPFGIVSIVYAAKVDNAWNSNLHADAMEAADKAKKWAIAGILTSGVALIIYFVLFAMGVAAMGGFAELLEGLQ